MIDDWGVRVPMLLSLLRKDPGQLDWVQEQNGTNQILIDILTKYGIEISGGDDLEQNVA